MVSQIKFLTSNPDDSGGYLTLIAGLRLANSPSTAVDCSLISLNGVIQGILWGSSIGVLTRNMRSLDR